MQNGHYLGLGPGQFAAEYLREEMVIPEPLPSVIERHDEKIFPLEYVDDLGSVGRADYGIAQRRAESAQSRGPHEELTDSGWLVAEHFLDQEVNDKPAVTGELPDEGARRRVLAQCEGREVDPGRPALGPADQIGQIGLAE